VQAMEISTSEKQKGFRYKVLCLYIMERDSIARISQQPHFSIVLFINYRRFLSPKRASSQLSILLELPHNVIPASLGCIGMTDL
jgi:hypothetical protein